MELATNIFRGAYSNGKFKMGVAGFDEAMWPKPSKYEVSTFGGKYYQKDEMEKQGISFAKITEQNRKRKFTIVSEVNLTIFNFILPIYVNFRILIDYFSP